MGYYEMLHVTRMLEMKGNDTSQWGTHSKPNMYKLYIK